MSRYLLMLTNVPRQTPWQTCDTNTTQPGPAPPGHHGHPGHRAPCTHGPKLRANGQVTSDQVYCLYKQWGMADAGLQDCRWSVSPLYKQLLQAAAAYQAATTVLQRCTSSSLSSREESFKYFLVKLNIFIATASFWLISDRVNNGCTP